MEITLKEITPEKSTQERVSLKAPAPVKQKEYVADKVELSPTIQAFDKRPKVFTNNPYSPLEVIKNRKETLTPTAEQAVMNPLYNRVGHLLGVDMSHDWNTYYDKVVQVVELAKEKSKLEDPEKLMSWIFKRAGEAPSMSGKRITDVLVSLKLGSNPIVKNVESKPKIVYKTVYKYIKPKDETKQFVTRWMNKTMEAYGV